MSRAPQEPGISWICRTGFERARFLDMHRRLLPVNARLLAVVLLAIAPAAPLVDDAAAMIPAVLAIAVFGVVQRVATRFARPEVWVFSALLGTEVAICLTAVLNGSQHEGALAMVCWPAAGICGRFRTLPAAVGTVFALALVCLSALAFDGQVVLADPLRLTLILAVIVAVGAVAVALRDSDVEHRGAAVIDPLTGLLNRSALALRSAEIEQQSAITGQPVGLIVADLDHFKAVNDRHGHAAGDRVLAETAYLLRRELRAYDLAYRLGGEEFAILLPGADPEKTAELAEQLLAAIGDEPIAGLAVTASLGAAGTAAGETFCWAREFARADAALYAAKRAGRDRVCAADAALVAA